ncbi:SUI1 family translation initiation factor, partial [Burkholderia cenocepacia]|uniref:hypothetical protein n=1 Tax=Burkholderia cenocepacia TaxID=95486 RepID=UPI0038CBF5EC
MAAITHDVVGVEAMCFDARDAVARVHAGLRELGVLGAVVSEPFDADTGIVTARVAARRGGDPLVLVDGELGTIDAQELAERLRMRCAASVLVVRSGQRVGLSTMEAALDRIRDDPRTSRTWVVLPTRPLDEVSSLPEAAR